MNYTEIIYNFIKDISKCIFYELARLFQYYLAILLHGYSIIFINKK